MHAAALVDALKRLLKAQGLTYAVLASRLGLSEAGVKRMFSRRDFSLQRLEDVCRIAGIDFAELVAAAAPAVDAPRHLTVEQERAIVSEPKLLLVALCAIGGWTLEQIVAHYAISRTECVRCLARLDRRGIVTLAPGNRIKPRVGPAFEWRPDGPIQRYFRERVQAEYLAGRFDAADECFLFATGLLSKASTALLIRRLREVVEEFVELQRRDRPLPWNQRFGSTLLVATRPWEPRTFRALRRGRG